MKETLAAVAAAAVVGTLFLVGCDQGKVLDAELILKQTIVKHDSLDNWPKTRLYIHIQEPRISNPHRYSILNLDNSSNTFRLSRNRDQHISEHIVDSNGNSLVLLNGKTEIDTTLIKKYRLDASRNMGYKNFYQLIYGLPMSLNNSYKDIINSSEAMFHGVECYKIELELKETIISNYWNLFVSKSSLEISGVEIIVPENEDGGERIYFEELIIVNGIKIPRIRHWHELNSDTYSGSDLIIKEMPN